MDYILDILFYSALFIFLLISVFMLGFRLGDLADDNVLDNKNCNCICMENNN